MTDAGWDLGSGAKISRVTVHERFGGGGQGGISPSARTPNVLIFSDPHAGTQYGYVFDGWRGGVFHYTGEGQVGDQLMRAGNRAIRDHVSHGRSLRVFDGVRGEVEYVGAFQLATDAPFHYAEAPDRNGDTRQVVVFRLLPVEEALALRAHAAAADPVVPSVSSVVTEIPVETHRTDTMIVQPTRESREAIRREQPLVRDFQRHLERLNHEVVRLRCLPEGEVEAIVCDLFDKTANVIYEAKGSGTRSAIRMALGQLADYARFAPRGVRRAVLLNERPRPDLEKVLVGEGVAAAWRSSNGVFSDNVGGALVT